MHDLPKCHHQVDKSPRHCKEMAESKQVTSQWSSVGRLVHTPYFSGRLYSPQLHEEDLSRPQSLVVPFQGPTEQATGESALSPPPPEEK